MICMRGGKCLWRWYDSAFKINTNIDKTKGNYLKIVINSPTDTDISIALSEKSIISFSVIGSPLAKTYLIRISSLAEWYTTENLNLNIKLNNTEIKSIDLLEGD